MLSFGLLCAALAGASAGVVVPGLRYTNGWALTNDVIPVGTNVKFTIAVKEQGLEEVRLPLFLFRRSGVLGRVQRSACRPADYRVYVWHCTPPPLQQRHSAPRRDTVHLAPLHHGDSGWSCVEE